MSETNEPREPDIVDRVLHSFDHVLDIIHDKVLRPLLLAGRAIAFGFIIVLAVVVLLTVLVVGVVGDTKLYGLANPSRLEVYLPFRQSPSNGMNRMQPYVPSTFGNAISMYEPRGQI